MANKRYYQYLYTKQPMLKAIYGSITFGATGAVASSSGAGVLSVTRLNTGLYQVKLADNYSNFLKLEWDAQSGVSGGAVTAGSFVTGTQYQIVSLGNTNWGAIGLDSNYTTAIGQTFVATGAGSGTGTAKILVASGIIAVESVAPGAALTNLYPNQGKGSSIFLNVYGLPASGQVASLADPASGSSLNYALYFRDSSVGAY